MKKSDDRKSHPQLTPEVMLQIRISNERTSQALLDGLNKSVLLEELIDNTVLLVKALEFAATKHKDQRRKDAEASPYINHPIALVKILCVERGVTDIEVLCAALLHDTIEDTETTAEELELFFGKSIASIVMEVTDDKSLSKEDRKQLQIEHAHHASEKAKLVKITDKIANLRDILNRPPANWPIERKQKYFDWAKQVVDAMRGTNNALEADFDKLFAKRP